MTLSADGRYAFVADGTSGTHVVDDQDLTAPKLIGQIYSSANAKNVEMSADGKTLVVSGDEGIGLSQWSHRSPSPQNLMLLAR